jgi:hypothetical protein
MTYRNIYRKAFRLTAYSKWPHKQRSVSARPDAYHLPLSSPRSRIGGSLPTLRVYPGPYYPLSTIGTVHWAYDIFRAFEGMEESKNEK